MIDKELWDLLGQFISNSPDLKCLNASDAEICESEAKLDLFFSDFFRYYLKNFSVEKIGVFNMHNMHSKNNLSHVLKSSILTNTKKFRDENNTADKDFYVIAKNNDDEFIVSDKKGEILVVKHDNSLLKIAEDFEDFLRSALATNSN